MRFAKGERKETSSRMVFNNEYLRNLKVALFYRCSFLLSSSFCVCCFQKFGPSISSGMMKKLEPVLQMKKRPLNCHTTLATVQPLNACIKDRECKNQEDVYCFPSSPGERAAETTKKEEIKKEKQLSKTKAKKILKVCMISDIYGCICLR